MAYVLTEHRGEEAFGRTIIEAHGVAHCIEFSVDHIKQEPRITRTTSPSPVTTGTRITVTVPPLQWSDDRKIDLLGYCESELRRLVESYAWLNPHLSLRLTWNGEVKVDIPASDPGWRKWLPSWPTSPHWYDAGRLRRYMAAHVANRGSITVREFISEFAGMTATAKQKIVLAEIGASHVSLHNYFGLKKANVENIAKLLAALQKHTKEVKPAALGVIGKEHLSKMLEHFGADPATITYNRTFGETDGVPRVIEFAFAIHRGGLAAGAMGEPSRKVITGVNWSPGINNPFRQLGRGGASLDNLLAEVRASNKQPIIAVLHLACPRVAYTDRGKSAIVVEGEGSEQ
jgi:DNA topoisomerase VI subunit B